MTPLDRRALVAALSCVALGRPARALAATPDQRRFIAAAFAMKRDAERAGDQAYGAVVVRGETIVGWGPSRVIVNRDSSAHAEREAIRDARKRLGDDLSGCEMYSTSRPCAACEAAAAEANIARMYFGADASDAGRPRGG
jgi:tRNA(Arg) A34 adenosine deaminase TadA